MPFRWTKSVARKDNLASSKTFNNDYDQYKGLINGGLDRDNLPEDAIDGNNQAVDGCFHQYFNAEGIHTNDSVFDHHLFYGVSYNLYNGGWYLADTDLEETFKEGTTTVEFNAWYNCINNTGLGATLVQWIEFALFVDGNMLCSSSRLFNYMGQVHLAMTIPISSGTHKIQVGWRASGVESGVTGAQNTCYFDGGQLTAINRIR